MPGSPTALSVNLNKVALLRNARDLDLPSVDRAARTCLDAGADGLTIHPRPDGRHIRPRDVESLAALRDSFLLASTDAEFNIEGNPFAGAEAQPWGDYPGFIALVERAVDAGGVDQCTLVPDAPGQRTSDHGWNLRRDAERLAPVIAELQAMGCRVSLFMDADPDGMARAADVGADRVELYTEPYARAFADGNASAEIARFVAAARAAEAAGLGINAGHDLNLDNLGPFVAAVPGVLEVSIGHALTADALWTGLDAAVRAYKAVLTDAVGD